MENRQGYFKKLRQKIADFTGYDDVRQAAEIKVCKDVLAKVKNECEVTPEQIEHYEVNDRIIRDIGGIASALGFVHSMDIVEKIYLFLKGEI